MSDENTTAEQPDARSFEERVFARFDVIDARLTKLEDAADRRSVETKAIWARARSEMIEMRAEMNARFDYVERKLDVLNRDVPTTAGSNTSQPERLQISEHLRHESERKFNLNGNEFAFRHRVGKFAVSTNTMSYWIEGGKWSMPEQRFKKLEAAYSYDPVMPPCFCSLSRALGKGWDKDASVKATNLRNI